MAIWCADGLECINNTFRYNTVENGWRAAGAALYGGKDNKFYNIIIKDNLDIGITITNTFQGIGFNDNGMHDFHAISLVGCGTFNATYNDRVGAINITHASGAGTKVQNVRLYNIDVIDSKCDAIRIAKASGSGIFNLSFENVTINGTAKEYPFNNVGNLTQGRGYAVFFDKYPLGAATYCNLSYSNLGGSSNGTAFNTIQKGTFSWTSVTGCDSAAVTGVNLLPADTSIAGGETLQLFPDFIPANATNKIILYTSSNPVVATVNYDGFITGLSKGQTVITVTTQDGNFSATSNINVTSNPNIVYRIKSRWQNTFLYDAGDRVKYSLTAGNDTYLWQIEDIDGVKEIKNYSTGDYMHISNLLGYVQCTSRLPGVTSSKWVLEDAGSDFVRLKSESNKTDYIHIENLQNHAQYGTIETTWWSAMWVFEPMLIVTSVPNLSLEKAAGIFPNPSNGHFNLSLSNFARNEKVSITIFNFTGQAIYTNFCIIDDFGLRNVEIDAHKILKPGNYYVIAMGDINFAHAKLLINR
jgi:uncharacterized protein YjdB